jgi:polar amino acid transport system substrate-binding protein
MRVERFAEPRSGNAMLGARFAWACAIGFFLGATAMPAASQTLDRIREAGRITFGYVAHARPFVYRNEAGEAEGYAIDLCKQIAAEVKSKLALPALDVEWVPLGIDARTSQVREGGVDVMCTPAVPTLARRREVAFSLPVFPGGNRAVIRRDTPTSLREALQGTPSTEPVWRGSPAAKVLQRTIFAVVSGTTSEGWLKARAELLQVNAEILEVLDYRSGLEKLLDHRVDVLFGDRAVILGEMSEAAHQRLMVVDRQFTHELYALPIPRNDDDFRLVVDAALSRLYASDGFGELYAEWFKEFNDQTRTFFLWNTFPEDARNMRLTERYRESDPPWVQDVRLAGNRP